MAVKRSMSKKKEPIKRQIKRAPAAPAEVLPDPADVVDAEVPPAATPAALQDDFIEAPLTPEQQAENDAIDGHNAAADAINAVIPETNKLNKTLEKFKRSQEYKDLMALPIEERRKIIDADQEELKAKKMKIKYNKKD